MADPAELREVVVGDGGDEGAETGAVDLGGEAVDELTDRVDELTSVVESLVETEFDVELPVVGVMRVKRIVRLVARPPAPTTVKV